MKRNIAYLRIMKQSIEKSYAAGMDFQLKNETEKITNLVIFLNSKYSREHYWEWLKIQFSQGVYVNVQQNGNATPGWAQSPRVNKAQAKWAEAQKRLKIDKDTGAGCCGYFFSFIIIASSLIIGAMALSWVR